MISNNKVLWMGSSYLLWGLFSGCATLPESVSSVFSRHQTTAENPLLGPGSEEELARSLMVGDDLLMPEGGGKTVATETTVPVPSVETVSALEESRVYQGSGRFIHYPELAEKPPKKGFKLNFDGTRLRDVVKAVLGDILKKNYLMDASVKGKVTLITVRSLSKSAVLPVLESVLRMHGAVLIQEKEMMRIVPAKKLSTELLSPVMADKDHLGYSVRVFPLRYIAATELQKILGASIPKQHILQVDDARNLLIVRGEGPVLDRVSETVRIFDVDWLSGKSVGLFPVKNAELSAISIELGAILGREDKNLIAGGMIKLLSIERLNALLVISAQEKYLHRVQKWIKRLDKSHYTVGQRLYVYRVQNGVAKEMAKLLNELFGQAATNGGRSPIQLAPGLKSAEISAQGSQAVTAERIKIIADESNNALLILTDNPGYRLVSDAIKKLDVTPLQVLVEATIAEVSLSDELRYGLEWFFRGEVKGGRSGEGLLNLGNALAPAAPGFSYAVKSGERTLAMLNTLASESRVKIVSSPSVMVLNNKTATIQVGDEVPVLTQQATNLEAANSPTGDNEEGSQTQVVNSIQYKETGVLLSVTPRVNTGGLVSMEIKQEVSNVSNTQSSGIDSPTINQRKIETTIAVGSDQTVVLGGLIRENKGESKGGVPWLRAIPILGWLFGSAGQDAQRTELVVLITPRVVDNQNRLKAVTDEFRLKMQDVVGVY